MPAKGPFAAAEPLEARRLFAFLTKFNLAATSAEEGNYGLAFDGTNFLAAIEKDHKIGAQLITPAGAAAAPFVSTGRFGNHTAASFGGQPLVAFGGGKYLMIWGDSAVATHDIWGVFITKAGKLSGSPFAISKGSSEEQTAGVAFDGTRFFVTYLKNASSGQNNTIVAGRFVSTAGSVGSEVRISTGAGDQVLNNVAFDGTRYLVAWVDDTNDTDVRARFVSKTGSLGSEFFINNSAGASDSPCAVAFNGSNYLVAFVDQVGADPLNYDLFAQRISKAGAKLGGVITIADNPRRQLIPYICSDGNNWLVTFTNFTKDLDGDFQLDGLSEGTFIDVFGTLLNRDGMKVGNNFVVNSAAGFQLGGGCAFGANTFITAWNDGTFLNAVSGQFEFTNVLAAKIIPVPSARVAGGALTVTGTNLADGVALAISGSKLIVEMGNSRRQEFNLASVTSITINAGAGNDRVTLLTGVAAATINGGKGRDTIIGGDFADRITPGPDTDTVTSGAGNDLIFASGDSAIDDLSGNSGTDSATVDATDILNSIENPTIV
jgi:hypothetical protein